ncbi:MAG: hypothetical protein IBX70_04345 [Clostridia bacterium]|nr:hypothetical protein [Clostridia bacterium]
MRKGYGLFIIALGVIAILLNLYGPLQESSKIHIGMLYSSEMDDSKGIAFFDNSSELIAMAKDGRFDAVLLNGLEYIKNYNQLFEYTALSVQPEDYGIVYFEKPEDNVPKIAITDRLVAEYFIEKTKWLNYDIIQYHSEQEAFNAFSEGMVDYAVLRTPYLSQSLTAGAKLVKTAVDENLTDHLVLIHKRFKNTSENWTLDSFQTSLNIHSMDIPNEDALIESIRWLYSKNYIATRYYYKDLVDILE